MAKKLESRNIDPDTFLDSYRPVTVNSPPSGSEKPVAQEQVTQPSRKVSTKDTPGNSAEAQEYLDKYVRAGGDTSYRTGRSVYLTPDVHERLSAIDSFLSDGRKKIFSAYVNNVLMEHFERYADLIQELIQEKINNSNPFTRKCKKK